jgi:hypothetical protein
MRQQNKAVQVYDLYNKESAVCFTGHRTLPRGDLLSFAKTFYQKHLAIQRFAMLYLERVKIFSALGDFIRCVNYFICGNAKRGLSYVLFRVQIF